MKNIFVGTKYYNYKKEKDELEILKVVRIKNQNSLVLKNEKTGEEYRMNPEELESKYTRLKPDAFISFSIAIMKSKTNKVKDVIVAMIRNDDSDNDGLPYCVCRQNIDDLFSNQINKPIYEDGNIVNYYGASISKDTIPEDVPYEMTLACDEIEYSIMVSYYIGDKLDDILGLIKVSKFDTTLVNLATLSDKFKYIKGYCNSLKELLLLNDFMYDVLQGFNIYKIPFEVEKVNDFELNPIQRRYLEDYLKTEMFKTYVIEYDKEIDLKKIQRNYIMVSDINEKIYIVAYDKGEYINRNYRDNIKDKRDAITLLKLKRKNHK